MNIYELRELLRDWNDGLIGSENFHKCVLAAEFAARANERARVLAEVEDVLREMRGAGKSPGYSRVGDYADRIEAALAKEGSRG